MKKTITMTLALLLTLLTALSTVAYAATAVRPTVTETKGKYITTGVKVPATADYEVYLAGTYTYKISVADNQLMIDGTYFGLRPPYNALLDNVLNSAPTDTAITALCGARSDKEIKDALSALPAELYKKIMATLKIQLVKPMLYTTYSTGSDGLARVEESCLLLPKNNQSILTTTIPVVRSTIATDITYLPTLSLSLDLSGVADGEYNLQELVSDGKAGHQEGKYWDDVVVVIHNGVASLQVVEDDYGWATTKGGKAIYGKYYPDWWYTSDWSLDIWAIRR